MGVLEKMVKMQGIIGSNLPSQKKYKEMQDELEYKKMQLENTQTTQERLKEVRRGGLARAGAGLARGVGPAGRGLQDMETAQSLSTPALHGPNFHASMCKCKHHCITLRGTSFCPAGADHAAHRAGEDRYAGGQDQAGADAAGGAAGGHGEGDGRVRQRESQGRWWE